MTVITKSMEMLQIHGRGLKILDHIEQNPTQFPLQLKEKINLFITDGKKHMHMYANVLADNVFEVK